MVAHLVFQIRIHLRRLLWFKKIWTQSRGATLDKAISKAVQNSMRLAGKGPLPMVALPLSCALKITIVSLIRAYSIKLLAMIQSLLKQAVTTRLKRNPRIVSPKTTKKKSNLSK